MSFREILNSTKVFEQAPGLLAVIVMAVLFFAEFRAQHKEDLQARAECRQVIQANTQALATFTEVFRMTLSGGRL